MAFCLFGALGCSRALPAPADPDQARETLVAALDAWKKGEKIETLPERSPPIRVRDDDWMSGWTLRSYAIGAHEAIGRQRRVAVKLSLQDAKGKTAVKNVHYEIDTNPATVIVRAFE